MSLNKKQAAIKFIRTARKHPGFFTQEVLGDHLWQKQKEILNAIQHDDVTVGSCHGAGKSFIASRVVLHGLSVFPDTQIITTAPTNRQVKKILWKEIRSGHSKAKLPIGGRVLTKEMQVDNEWFAMGFSTDDTNQFQGFHAGRTIVVVDEAAGVTEDIYNGIDGVLSGENSRLLLIGNPTSRSGRFFQSHKSDNYIKFNISAFDTPNFTKFGITEQDIINDTWEEKIDGKLPYPKLVTPKWVAARLEGWGRNSPLYQAKVLGQFPENEEDTIIPLYLWKEAANHRLEPTENIRAGLDPARFGSDKTALAIKKGPVLYKKIWQCSKMDTTYVANWLNRILQEEFGDRAKEIPVNIDTIGIGAGVADQARNTHNLNVKDFKSSEKANESDKFQNKRAEMYWNIRKLIKDRAFYPEFYDEKLENQMSALKYDYDSSGRIRAEKKENLKKRIGESPDKADAVCQAFYDSGQERAQLW